MEVRKLRRIILLHIGLVTFNLHFPKFWKVFMFMILGNVHDPYTHYSWLRTHQITQKNLRKYNILIEQSNELLFIYFHRNEIGLLGLVCVHNGWSQMEISDQPVAVCRLIHNLNSVVLLPGHVFRGLDCHPFWFL